MLEKIKVFLRDEEGLTTVEYAVAGTLVTIAVVTAFDNLGAAVDAGIAALTAAVQGN